MREVDTEAPVVWPAWCYSANTQESAIDVISRKGDPASELLPATSPTSYVQPSPNTILSGYGGGLKSRSRRKNPYTSSLASASSSLSVTSVPSTSPSGVGAEQSITNEKIQQHLQLSSFLINKKMLSERILMGFSGSSLDSVNSNNSTSDNLNSNTSSSNNNNNNNTSSANNRKNCDSNTTISGYDKIKNEAQIMDSSASNLKNGDLITTNNNGSTSSATMVNLVTSRIKNERLSPPLNGDVQSSISRSRSATPTSFPDTPPQSSDLTMTPNILNPSRTNEFQARNYSDFMRSLAAKYNNTNPNDTSTARNLFFDQQKFSNASTKPPNKESPSPPDVKRTSVPTPPQVPFVTPLFPGLPFSSAVFPPLIDMSSTQALVTLARAAKEAELQKILCQTQKRPGAAAAQSLSPALRSVIATTQQQLAQFNSQSLLLPSQFSVPQRSPSGRSPRNSQSPQQYRGEPSSSSVASTPATTSGSTASAKRSSSPPLDLSATQQSKRVKAESVTSSPATSPPGSSILATTTTATSGIASASYTKPKAESPAVGTTSSLNVEFPRHCRAQNDEISSWTVDDVCNFVNSIDICAEYVQKFRDQCIDGSGLPLLTEDHLTNSLGMKLGPALKLRSMLAKMLGGPCPCVSCTTLYQQQQQQQQQQLIVQHQPPTSAIHLTPPRVASSTISSSSSTSQLSGGSTTSSSSSSSSLNSNTNNVNNSNNTTNNTASNNLSATSSSVGGTAIGSANNPVRPASADSGS